jgi:hypothetical protein
MWREDDWRNWRKRIFAPAARAIGMTSPRPYDLRHSFVSLLIHEGRLSIVELAEQLGHNPSMCLATYTHVMAELRAAPKVNAEEQIWAARAAVNGSDDTGYGPNTAQEPIPGLSLEDLALGEEADGRTRTGDPFITSEVLYQLSYVGENRKLPAKPGNSASGCKPGKPTSRIPCTPGARGAHPAARSRSAPVP